MSELHTDTGAEKEEYSLVHSSKDKNNSKTVSPINPDEMYRILFNSISDAFIVCELICDDNGEAINYRILDANPAYENFSGISLDKLVNLKMTDIVTDDGKSRLIRISEVIKIGKSIRFVEYNKYLHGWFEVYIFSLGRDNLFGKIFTNISERKQAEDGLKISEERYRELFNSMSEAFVIQELIVLENGNQIDFRYLQANPAFEKLTGLNNVIGKTMLEVLPGIEPYWLKYYEEVVTTGKTLSFKKYAAPLGKWYDVVAWKFGGSESIKMAILFSDVTEQKFAEEALLESEERFRTMADNISQLAWMADANGFILWYNKRWYEFTGTTFEQVSGWGWTKVHHPDHVDRVVKKVKYSWETGIPWEDTFPIKGKDGEYRWFLSRAQPILNDAGKIVRWFGTNTDITDQILLEEDLSKTLICLRENEAKLHDAQKLANIGNIEIDFTNGQLEWSENVYNIFERDKNSGPPLLKEAESFVYPEDRKLFRELLDVNSGKMEKMEVDFRIKLGDKIKYLTYIATPYYDDQGKQIKQTGAVMDITERKLAEIKLEEAYKQIKERLSEKEILIRELYHRTKNNMQVISSLLGLKAAANPSDKDVEMIFSDMQNRIKAIALVHEKLYQSGNLSRVNLADYILDLVGLLLISHTVNSEKISFRHSLDQVYVLIDTAVPCGLIITELVLNTLKHAFPEDKEGYLEINLKKHEDDRIELTISDNGIGLNEDELYNEEKIGLLIFRNIAENQLEAVVESDHSNGVSWSMTFKDLLYKERV